jgi:hypothetical protein
VLAQVVHRDNVRVLQPGGKLCLAAEALDELAVDHQLRVQNLHRPRHVQQRAPPQRGEELVFAEVEGVVRHKERRKSGERGKFPRIGILYRIFYSLLPVALR